MSDLKVGAVIVTYNPEINRLKKVIDSIANQIDNIIIVDNNSKNVNDLIDLIRNYSNIEIIKNGQNYGIGKALNIGVKILKCKVEWILTLDQDTILLKKINDVFDILKIELNKKKIDMKKIGIIFLNYIEINKKVDENFYIDKKLPIIISGCLINKIIFERGLKFREEFFLDHIDTDFDYQVKHEGFLILKTYEKYTDHKLGLKVVLKNEGEIIFEPEWRMYLMTRNLVKLLIENKIKLNFFINQILIWDYKLIKTKKIKNVIKEVLRSNMFGILDGIRNKLGPPFYRYKI
ncbi:MAG: glycosyltransferase [Thermoplasmata archaeon]